MKKLFAGISFVLALLPVFAASNDSTRGTKASANAYRQNQRNTYYMVTIPDVDTECRNRIYQCFSEYCGDMTVIPGQSGGRCSYTTENELYNWALICLQRDKSPLLPQYNANNKTGSNGLNTAARLCPSYIQSELLSYLSIANMAEKLTLQRSDECVARRQELSAALSCHQVALTYGSDTQNRLISQLTDVCGSDMPGGSTAMVQKFANAGNLGASVLGWAEKLVSADLSNKGPEWKSAMDQVLAYYTNRMNLACGDNVQMNTPVRDTETGNGSGAYPTLTTIATLAMDTYAYNTVQDIQDKARLNAPIETIWNKVNSMTDVYDYQTAKQVVNAGLTNSPLVQNAFLSSAQMSSMQDAYIGGTKVFILLDSARCWIVPVRTMTTNEQSAVAQVFASCASR